MNHPLNWEFLPWHVDPVLFHLGPLAIRWYGLMYLAAFAVCYHLIAYRLRSEGSRQFHIAHIDDVLSWLVAGVLIGGRLGYVLFYGWTYFSQHPLEIFLPFSLEGGAHFTGISGMSYHGGLVGSAIAVLLYCRRKVLAPLAFADLIVPTIPLGYTFGRLGNFLNGELWGRITDVPWAMRFPLDPAGLVQQGIPPPLRHPSQLYEACGEGLLLGAFLWAVRKHPFFRERMLATYLIGYAMIRFLIEFTREPDVHLGLILGPFSMGQALCIVMAGIGLALFIAKRPSGTTSSEASGAMA